ncbi:hypothetical protein [Marilutibacter alkalisoli]|uniref:Secreted protein n=1 Tax=Marilutibacter alkalisoli TaxID=2591633 RepID=A0A514BW56_9GAMM|nr:hypothetical protein [Lysobacter alkalisoli]QDH71600.1 hypothetical protein FKV23_16985 [Lysobacter alkalisoli]
MPNMIKPLMPACLLAAVAIAFSPSLHAQGGPGDVGTQVARAVGSLHAMARACGAATDQQLAGLKQKQKAQHGQFGMDPATFDPGFDAGEKEVDQSMRNMSPVQKVEACAEVKQQFEEAARQLGETYGQ